MEGTIGEIRLFTGNFAPQNWAFCDGSLMNIAYHEAIYTILGTTYGGDGYTTFALPDLRGRIPIGTGQGPGLPNISLGQVGGTEMHTLSPAEMPAHNHYASATINVPTYSESGNKSVPSGSILAANAGAYTTEAADGMLAVTSSKINLSMVGNGTPIDIRNPSLALNYIICIEGIFPARNN